MKHHITNVCLLLTGLCVACSRSGTNEVHVLRMTNPDYPVRAIVNNIQGRVDVQVQIGAGGRVIFAKAIGANPLLEEAAENNVRQWEFGPFPPDCEFPIYHTVTYIFKLEGPPLGVVQVPFVVHTYLPDRVEIKTRPFKEDNGLRAIEATPGARPVGGKK